MTAAALWHRLIDYFDSDDPRLRLAGSVAFVVVGNQPFYPLYVWWIAGGVAAALSLVTWLSTPFFAAVPAVGRRSAHAGKILLLAAGLGNTAICAALLGTASGVELFYLPCLILAGTLFERRSAGIALGCSLTICAVAIAIVRAVPTAILLPVDSASLFKMHAASVAGLVCVIAYSLWKERRRAASG